VGAAYLTLFLANAAVFALFLFLTYYFQRVLGYSPIMTGVAFLPMMVAIAVVATLTQGVLLQHLTNAGHRRRRLDRLRCRSCNAHPGRRGQPVRGLGAVRTDPSSAHAATNMSCSPLSRPAIAASSRFSSLTRPG